MDIAVISTGYFPIPPTKGGAVESLVYALIVENERYNRHSFVIYSVYDYEAEVKASLIKNSSFVFIKTPLYIRILDKLLYYVFANVLHRDKNFSYRYILQKIYFEKAVSTYLSNSNHDVVLVENTPASFLPLKWLKRKKQFQARVYYHLHNEIRKTFGCDREILKCNGIIFVSNYICNMFMRRFPSYNGNKFILKNCNTNKIAIKETKKTLQAKYNLNHNKFNVLYVGRLSKEKGVLELIKAFEKCSTNDDRLIIIGGTFYDSDVISPYEREIRKYAKTTGKNITFTGYVWHDNISEYYKAADLVVLPSIWQEPAGLTIIEAMASGTPVITTDTGGITEYTEVGHCIVIPNNADIIDNLANSIMMVKFNIEYYTKMGQRAKEFAAQYNTKSYYLKFCEILESQ